MQNQPQPVSNEDLMLYPNPNFQKITRTQQVFVYVQKVSGRIHTDQKQDTPMPRWADVQVHRFGVPRTRLYVMFKRPTPKIATPLQVLLKMI